MKIFKSIYFYPIKILSHFKFSRSLLSYSRRKFNDPKINFLSHVNIFSFRTQENLWTENSIFANDSHFTCGGSKKKISVKFKQYRKMWRAHYF